MSNILDRSIPEKLKLALLLNKKKTVLIFCTLIIGILFIIWRFFFVMSWSVNIESAVWGLIVLWADFYGFSNLIFFSFETLYSRDLYEYFEVQTPKENYNPSVDVFICTYNEDANIIRKTALAATFINYDNKKVYILDDGHREEIRMIAQEINVNYITREDNKHFKAGNLNNALAQVGGDLVAVFDADHVPTKQFLEKIVKYFEDDSVALVQTPQTFYNPDPFQRNLNLQKFITNEQALFFKVIQPGRSFWNATICCGTNWIARRSAIDEIGGIPTESITEDMLTSIKLQEHRYKTLYLNEALAAGLSAESVGEYIRQRNRWAKGTFQIYFSKNNPLANNQLNLTQKMCYIGSINYYFVGIARIIYLLAPCIFILFNLQSTVATLHQLLLYQLPYLVFLIWTYLYISKGMRKPFFTEAYEALISYDLANMIIHYVFLPKKDIKFRVTEKNITFEKSYFDYVSMFPLLIMLLIMLLSLFLWPVCYYFDLRNHEGLIINGFWLVLNIAIMFLVMKVGFENPQKRKYTRIPVTKTFEMVANNTSYLLYGLDLSEGGAYVYLLSDDINFTEDQDVKFIIHEAEGNVEIPSKLLNFKKVNEKTFLRLQFPETTNAQEAALIRNIYSYNWRWQD